MPVLRSPRHLHGNLDPLRTDNCDRLIVEPTKPELSQAENRDDITRALRVTVASSTRMESGKATRVTPVERVDGKKR